MASVLSVIIGFVLTGLIGNKLVQSWQVRNWFLQQRFIGHEKEYLALKELADEIATLLGARIYHMQRLTSNLITSTDERFASSAVDYDDILKKWNERLTSFYVRLPLLASEELGIRLERQIHVPLVDVGADIEKLHYKRQNGKDIESSAVANIQRELNQIQGRAINFNKKMLRLTELKRTELYYGKEISFTTNNLKHFSTWHLIKALFVRDINTLSITRSTIDS